MNFRKFKTLLAFSTTDFMLHSTLIIGLTVQDYTGMNYLADKVKDVILDAGRTMYNVVSIVVFLVF